MKPDPIVAALRAVRDRLAARFNYDVDAIVRHVQSVEAASGRTCVHYRDRLKRGGWVRCEVKVRRDDVELIRTVASALRDPDRHAATRALLRDRLGDPRPRGFKELLASCPVDLDLDGTRDLGRDIEV